MKLIIDIPEDVYKRTIFYKEFHDLSDCVTTIKAIENGTPLEEELKDIREDMKDTFYDYKNNRYDVSMEGVLNVLDNHISELKGDEKC